MDQKIEGSGSDANRNKPKFHYGWVVFAVCFLMVFFALGFGSSTKSIYLEAITKDADIDIDRGFYSLTDTIRCLCSAIVNLFFARVAAVYTSSFVISGDFLDGKTTNVCSNSDP